MKVRFKFWGVPLRNPRPEETDLVIRIREGYCSIYEYLYDELKNEPEEYHQEFLYTRCTLEDLNTDFGWRFYTLKRL